MAIHQIDRSTALGMLLDHAGHDRAELAVLSQALIDSHVLLVGRPDPPAAPAHRPVPEK
jgi:hypothetical protein